MGVDMVLDRLITETILKDHDLSRIVHNPLEENRLDRPTIFIQFRRTLLSQVEDPHFGMTLVSPLCIVTRLNIDGEESKNPRCRHGAVS